MLFANVHVHDVIKRINNQRIQILKSFTTCDLTTLKIYSGTMHLGELVSYSLSR